MFKTTGKSGLRRASGTGGSGTRVAATALKGGGLVQGPVATPFMPQTPQEHGFDSNSPRLSGLED